MEKSSKRILLFCALSVILGLVLGLALHPRGDPQILEVERVDTVTILKPIAVRDTIIREVEVKLPIVRTEVREVYVPLNPQIEKVADSAEVVIPISQKVYSDSDYTAWVSGYDPSLDSIWIYRRTRLPPQRPRLQLSVGVGAIYNGRLSPGIFIGVSYPIKEIRL